MFNANKYLVDLIPEFRDIPEDQLPKVWRKYYLKSFRRWELWLGLVGVAGCVTLGDTVQSHLISLIPIQWATVIEWIITVVFAMFAGFIYYLLAIHAIRHEIREEKRFNPHKSVL